MDKIFDKPDVCAECNEELGRLFLFCRSCNKCICYNCFANHKMEHNYLPCKTLENNKAIAMDLGSGGYGPNMGNLWPSIDNDLISSHETKCPHAINYFEKNNSIFYCHDCREWLCLDCLDKHLDHVSMLHVGFNNGKRLRQIDPNLYDSNKELLLSTNAFKTEDGNIKLELEINNDNNVPLYDLRVMYTWKGLDYPIFTGNALETIDNEEYLCNSIDQIEMISPKETIKIDYEFFISEFLNQDLSSIITMVRFKDVFLGNGIAIEKSAVKTSID